MKKIIFKVLKFIGLVVLLIVVASIAVFVNKPTKEELKNNQEKKLIDKKLSSLRDSCENYIRGVVINKSTLDFPITGLSKWKGDDKNFYVTREFSAKNKFNLEQKYRASCIESTDGKIQYRIDELPGN